MASWKPADDYDPDSFYTDASDKKGRGDPVSVRLPADVARRIAILVQSGKIGAYQTHSDFIRDAIVHRLYHIAELTKDRELSRAVSMAVALADQRTIENERRDYHELMAMVDTTYIEYVTAGKSADAQSYIKNMLARIDAIPERYQDDYEKRLGAKLYPI